MTMKNKSALSEDINVPIICLDDDDDDDDLMVDSDYKMFFDHLRDDNNLNPLFQSNGNKRSKLDNKNPMKNRVSQHCKKDTVCFKAEITREIIQRDNRAAERRKKRIPELEATKDVPLVRKNESIRRDNKVRNFSHLKAETLRDSPLVRIEEDIQGHNKVSEGRKRKDDELKAETLSRSVPFVRTEENIHLRDNRISERRKRRIAESKDVNEASKVVHVELKDVNEASKVVPVEPKDVNEEASRMAQVMTQRNKGGLLRTRKKNEEESVVVTDKDYMSYLTWLVDSLKESPTKPTANLHKDLSDLDPPVSDTLKESTTVLEKDLLAKVKVEPDLDESLSDDSDIILVSDSPFFDGESTPFVSSKSVIVDLDKESSKEDETSSWFSKELMIDLKRPYNEREFLRLYREASMHRRMTRCRELRKGRESDYETNELGKSYFERFHDFHKAYKGLDRSDKARALELLRGFFFYLKNVSHDGAFKPWMD